jgi:hydrogenase expression/formation protein HypE
MRDATRGGVATVLCEFAESAGRGIVIRDLDVPVRPSVAGACELLGFEPLYLANEGKLVAVVAGSAAERVVEAMRAHPHGAEAAVIGTVTDDHPGKLLLETSIGNRRVLDMLSGEQLPRIC